MNSFGNHKFRLPRKLKKKCKQAGELAAIRFKQIDEIKIILPTLEKGRSFQITNHSDNSIIVSKQ